MLQIEGLAAAIPDELREQLEELRETARHGTEEVRRIARRLRPEALEELGLQSALAALASAFERADARIPVERRWIEPVTAAPQEQELVVYRVAQEALTNVARHAEATRGRSSSCATGREQIVLTVRDDGRGLPDGRRASSHGIRGHARARDAHRRELAIESRPGDGTEVRLAIPHIAR